MSLGCSFESVRRFFSTPLLTVSVLPQFSLKQLSRCKATTLHRRHAKYWRKGGMKKRERCVKQHIHMALDIVPFQVFLWVFWLRFRFSGLLHTKEAAVTTYFKEAPAIPYRQTTCEEHAVLCYVVVCYRRGLLRE